MKRSSYSIYFIILLLLAVAVLTVSCIQTGKQIAVSRAEADEVISQEPIDVKTIMLPGEVPLEMVWIPSGSFLMGSPEDEQDRHQPEGPQHEVTFAKGFWIGKYPITQAQWQSIMGNNPGSSGISVHLT